MPTINQLVRKGRKKLLLKVNPELWIHVLRKGGYVPGYILLHLRNLTQL